MAKFYGAIGYAETEETSPGVYTEDIIELNYYGDVIKNSRRWQAGGSLNDDLTVDNQISIIADTYAYQNFHLIKYVRWMGVPWKVIKIDVLRPRIILTMGGVYNGEQNPTTNTP